MRIIWFVSLGVNLLTWLLFNLHLRYPDYSLRGTFSEWLLSASLWMGLLIASALVFALSISRWQKFLTLMAHGLCLALLSWLLLQITFVTLFFGLGVCTTNFNSPSGKRSITIEDACFMDCSHTVYANYYIFQKQVGELYLDFGGVCERRGELMLKWDTSETAVNWQIDGGHGVIQLDLS